MDIRLSEYNNEKQVVQYFKSAEDVNIHISSRLSELEKTGLIQSIEEVNQEDILTGRGYVRIIHIYVKKEKVISCFRITIQHVE